MGGFAPHLFQWLSGRSVPFRPPKTSDFRTHVLKYDINDFWVRADLREDKMISPAPGFWSDLGPLGPPRRAPGALGRASARKIAQVAPKISLGAHKPYEFIGFGAMDVTKPYPINS